MYRVGIDIGGTFTDMLLVGEDGGAVIGKTLTTPGDPSLAVENALRPALDNGAVKAGERGTLIHGTTLVTNALIERKGVAHDGGFSRCGRDCPGAPLRAL
jgi:N-methylhydantoinase A